jgi:DNA-directed RNA polymerase sigma subunit (sigma70/sigma32)
VRVTAETVFEDDRRALHFEDLDGPAPSQVGCTETVALLRAIEAAAAASQSLMAGEAPALEQVELRRAVLRGARAKRTLVKAGLHDVWWYARFRSRPLRRYRGEFEDLMQEGLIGLLEAVDALGSDAGELFPAYASHWMQDAVRTASGERALRRRVGAPSRPRRAAHAGLPNLPT